MLVVEDDEDIRASLSDILELKGYRCVGAANGAVALETLESLRQKDLLPCLILLDLMMPTMDGGAFRAKQLEHPTWSTIPVLLMSAYRDIAERARTLGLEYLAKPLGVNRLLEEIQRYCPGERCNRAHRRSAG